MFGYATDETESLMPAPLFYSHLLLKKLSEMRHAGSAPFLGPDSKSQLTLEYENNIPVKAHKIVVSTQHEEGYDQDKLKDLVMG